MMQCVMQKKPPPARTARGFLPFRVCPKPAKSDMSFPISAPPAEMTRAIKYSKEAHPSMSALLLVLNHSGGKRSGDPVIGRSGDRKSKSIGPQSAHAPTDNRGSNYGRHLSGVVPPEWL